jgi:DNA-binding LacI/PurR family transcriptional regulator
LTRAEERGYRRIGLVGSDDLDRRFQHLSTAAVQVFITTRRRAATVERLNVDLAAAHPEICAQVAVWAKRRKLDAILSHYNIHEELMAAGLRIPEDVGYVHLHSSDDPAVTSLDQNQNWIGRKTTDVVVGMINRNEFQLPAQSQTIMIPSLWREGETLPARVRGRSRGRTV